MCIFLQVIKLCKSKPTGIEFLHPTLFAAKYLSFKAVSSKSKSFFDDFERNAPSSHTHCDWHRVARFPLHSMYHTPFKTCNTVFIFYMWKVRLVYRVFVRACSILTNTAAIVAPFSPLTGSILRPYNNPHQTFPFRLSLMCFHKRLENQMFALCFLLYSATQEMLLYVVTYLLQQTTVTGGSTKMMFYSNF